MPWESRVTPITVLRCLVHAKIPKVLAVTLLVLTNTYDMYATDIF
jgi:hypothetical protein